MIVTLSPGNIKLFEYSNEDNKLRKSLELHKKNVRTIEFDSAGARLYSGSEDRAIKVTDMVRN